MLDDLSAISGLLRDGTTLELAEIVVERLNAAGINDVWALWEFADASSGLAHGVRWAQRRNGQWFALNSSLWTFLADGGSLPDEGLLLAAGPPLEAEVGSVVEGTTASRMLVLA